MEALENPTILNTFTIVSDGLKTEQLSALLFELHRIQYILLEEEEVPGLFEQVSSDEIFGLVTRGCDLLSWPSTAVVEPSSSPSPSSSLTRPYTALGFVLVSTVIEIYRRLWRKLEEPTLFIRPTEPDLVTPMELPPHPTNSSTFRRVKSYSAAAAMVCHLQILEEALEWLSPACRQAQKALIGLREDICQSVGLVGQQRHN